MILVETSSGARSKAMYWLDEDMTWETVPDEMEEPRIDHCQVQINDCEIAFIGGCRGDDTSACSDVTASDVVDIWNYKERTWRTGPKLVLFYKYVILKKDLTKNTSSIA